MIGDRERERARKGRADEIAKGGGADGGDARGTANRASAPLVKDLPSSCSCLF
jgi:hypothetical protein